MSSGSIVVSLADPSYQRALGDGLVVRWSTPKDAEGLARLCAEAFRDEESDPPNIYFGNWIYDLMSGRHPLAGRLRAGGGYTHQRDRGGRGADAPDVGV